VLTGFRRDRGLRDLGATWLNMKLEGRTSGAYARVGLARCHRNAGVHGAGQHLDALLEMTRSLAAVSLFPTGDLSILVPVLCRGDLWPVFTLPNAIGVTPFFCVR